MGTCGAHRLVSMTGAHWMKGQEAGYRVSYVVCNLLGHGREFRFWSKRDGKPLHESQVEEHHNLISYFYRVPLEARWEMVKWSLVGQYGKQGTRKDSLCAFKWRCQHHGSHGWLVNIHSSCHHFFHLHFFPLKKIFFLLK